MKRVRPRDRAGPPPAIRWVGGTGGYLSLLDQTALPARAVRIAVRDPETLRGAIRRLAVRGAPAIGVAAAYGVVLGAQT
ncbi:MAG: S-methyl-5-thioribose-1-phosphate isomerase, partial [Planctomycetota bacterium]